MNKGLGQHNDNTGLLTSTHLSMITYHSKVPQFYDEIKILLPLNLNEKHHLLFKFYHVSCSNAKVASNGTNPTTVASMENINNETNESELNSQSVLSYNSGESDSVESLIGYAWLPIFKNGRLLNGEKHLPVAQSLCSNYLSFEKIGLGQTVGPPDIKWVDNMKLLFRLNLNVQSTVHTTVYLYSIQR